MIPDPVLHIIQHSLGVDQYGQGEQYRNRFITGEGSIDHPICTEAVQRGLMRCVRAKYELYGGMDVFVVTEEGKQWMVENSPPPPKLTRGQRRYQAYLDYDGGESFGEWLRSGRRSAA